MSTATQTPPRAMLAPTPNTRPRGEDHTPGTDRSIADAQSESVGSGLYFPTDRTTLDAHSRCVGGESDTATGAMDRTAPIRGPRPSLFDPSLYVLAQFLDDVEGLRKAQGNRLRGLTATEPDEDGVMRGFGLDATHPVVATITALGDQLDAIEHQAVLALNRTMRAHPLAPWQKQARGVGEKQLARLLAAIGDPYINTHTGLPRTVSQLWAYSGLHTLPTVGQSLVDAQKGIAGGGANIPAGANESTAPVDRSRQPGADIAARRRKGEQANWSTTAKTRAYLIATSCVKSGGEYRDVYDARRAHTAATHPDWTPGHSHNDALRITSKRILRDLWRASRDYYDSEVES